MSLQNVVGLAVVSCALDGLHVDSYSCQVFVKGINPADSLWLLEYCVCQGDVNW